jgi:hypothetical protein
MRLFLAALLVVATFAFVVLLISRLFPYGAGWAGLCLAITCLYASTFAAWALLGSETAEQGAGETPGEITQPHQVRDNLLYFAVGMVAVTITVAVIIHDDKRGMVRTFKNDWFVGIGSACVALGYVAKAFWMFRRNWRLWAIIAALFLLFTTATVSILSQMEKVPLLLMGPLANVELLIAFIALRWFMGRQSIRDGSHTP